jgi:hypothetical protein
LAKAVRAEREVVVSEAAAMHGSAPPRREQRFHALDLAHVQVNPWLIAITVSLATFMEVMDTSSSSGSSPARNPKEATDRAMAPP